MTKKKKSIDELIAKSSFGTPGAVAVRRLSMLEKAQDEFEEFALEKVRQELREKIADAIRDRGEAEWKPTSIFRVASVMETISNAVRKGKLG